MSKFEYPVRIETKQEGLLETGWSAGQRERDCLLMGTFTENMANTLIKINDLYEHEQPAISLQNQLNILLCCVKAQKQNIRANRKVYEAAIKRRKKGEENG